MTKKCKHCGQVKGVDEFYSFRDRWVGKLYLSSRCRPCHQAYKKTSERTPRNRKAEKLQLRYGLTYDQWEDMREKEDHRCMICGISEDEMGKRLDVDHCHATGKVRGVLCNPCNTMLGHGRDDFRILEAAAAYLKRNAGGYK